MSSDNKVTLRVEQMEERDAPSASPISPANHDLLPTGAVDQTPTPPDHVSAGLVHPQMHNNTPDFMSLERPKHVAEPPRVDEHRVGRSEDPDPLAMFPERRVFSGRELLELHALQRAEKQATGKGAEGAVEVAPQPRIRDNAGTAVEAKEWNPTSGPKEESKPGTAAPGGASMQQDGNPTPQMEVDDLGAITGGIEID